MILNLFLFFDTVFQSQESNSFDWFRLLEILSTLSVGGAALYFTYLQYSNQEVKKNILKMQLEAVSKLVQELQETIFAFTMEFVNETDGDGELGVIYFHEIGQASLRNDYQAALSNKNFYISSDCLHRTKFVSFHSNPFLPKSIADKLKIFSDINYAASSIGKPEGNFVILMTMDELRDKNPTEITNSYKLIDPHYRTLENYFDSIIQVKYAIRFWCAEFKVKNMNI